ncbi:MAG: carboxypeptidase regulatory-like domain-containing protein, partial [Parapedobacter sp.]
MKYISLLNMLLLTVSVYTKVYAQEVTLRGAVVDERNAPLDLATVNLLRAKDSTVLKTAFPDASGNYVFVNVTPGEYRVSAVLVGYADAVSQVVKITAAAGTQDLGVLLLKSTNTVLAEVAVTAPQRPLVERKPDMLV